MVTVVAEAHECGGCGLSFSQIKHLKDHVKDVHPHFKLPNKNIVEIAETEINKNNEVEEETNKADDNDSNIGNSDQNDNQGDATERDIGLVEMVDGSNVDKIMEFDIESDIQHGTSSLFRYDKIKNSFKHDGKKSYQEFYLDLRSARYKTLLKNNGDIKFNGTTIDNDEIMTPAIESEIVLDWLEGIDDRLPEYIEQKYEMELCTVTLPDLQIEISRNLDAYLIVLDIQNNEVVEFQNQIESPSLPEMEKNKNTEVTEVQKQVQTDCAEIDIDQEFNLQVENEDPNELNSKDDDYTMENILNTSKDADLKHHTCDECGKIFSLLENLQNHIKTVHIYDPSHCSLCEGKIFKNKTYLSQHLKRVHKDFNLPKEEITKSNSVLRNSDIEKEEQVLNLTSVKEKSTRADDDYVMMDHSEINDQVLGKLKATLKGHKCHLCNKLFSRINNLKQHIKAKHKDFNPPEENIVKSNEPRFCTFCGKMFKNQTYLTQHLQQFHKEKVSKNQTMTETTIADNDHIIMDNSEIKKESTSEDNEHDMRNTSEIKKESDDAVFLDDSKKEIKTEGNGQVLDEFEAKSENYKCDVCSKTFSQISGLKFHIKCTHTYEPCSCNFCDVKFKNQAYLTQHLQQFHQDKFPKKEKDEFKCDHCGAEFPGNFKLTMHIRVHTGEKPFSCEECGKTFSQAGSLREHIKLHNGQKDHLCDDCGQSFMRQSKLVIHRRIHTGERPFQCDECAKGFRDSTKLIQHKLIHADTKPYQCDDCGKEFVANAKLKIHKRRVHTGERPYQCDECVESFHVQSLLTFHKRRHTGVAEFVCDICNKGFYDFGSLNKHKKIHLDEKKYSCEQCGKAFFHPAHLKAHSTVHTGERPFSCTVCHKRFSRQNNLKVHLRLHTGEKPFVCNICGVRKREKIQVVKHMKQHMSDLPNFIN